MSDQSSLLDVLQSYFDLLYTCDVRNFDKVFHENSQLQAIGPKGYTRLSAAEYKEILRTRKSPQSAGAVRQDEVVSIDQSSEVSAAAKVKALVNGVRFCDYLSLLRIDGEWRIVSKVYSTLSE